MELMSHVQKLIELKKRQIAENYEIKCFAIFNLQFNIKIITCMVFAKIHLRSF